MATADGGSTRDRRRGTVRRRSVVPALVAAVAVVAGFGAAWGCSVAEDSLVDRALGTWTCSEPDGDPPFSIEIERGRFTATMDERSPGAPPAGSELTGTWDLDGTELTFGVDEDRTVTVEGVSEDATELRSQLAGQDERLAVERVSDDEVTFATTDEGATTWTCRRVD